MADSVHNESSGDPTYLVQVGSTDNVHMHINAVPVQRPEPPRQLPPSHAKYTNRSQELNTFADVVHHVHQDRDGRTVLLTGPNGIGKSALLAELARQHVESFSHGVLTVDLDSYRDREGNADYAAALTTLLRELQVPEASRPAELHQLEAKLRSITTDREILLLLDGAAAKSEIERFPLGSGPHLRVVACHPAFADATSMVSAAGAELLALDRLEPPDGLALLGAFPHVAQRLQQPAEEASAQRLVELCGGLPPVLRMAAAHLTTQPELTITALVDAARATYLANPATAPVDAVTALFLDSLSPDRIELLDRLAAHPGQFFPSELATMVMGDTDGTTNRLLQELAQASVLRPTGQDSYNILELVRVRARQRREALPEEQRRADDEAFLRFYTVAHASADLALHRERLRLADVLEPSQFTVAQWEYRPPFTDAAEAADWQDRHLAHIPDLMRLAVDRDFPTAALLLADAAWPTLYARRRLATGAAIYSYAVQVARAHGHATGQVRCLCYLARLFLEQQNTERARSCIVEAEELLERSPHPLTRAVVLETRAALYRNTAQPAAARELLIKSRDLHHRAQRPRGEALQGYQLGEACRELGELNQSLAELASAEAVATAQISSPRSDSDWGFLLARIRRAQAETLHQLGNLDEARNAAEHAQHFFAEQRQPVREIQALRVLVGVAEQRQDRTAQQVLLRRLHLICSHYHLDIEADEARAQLTELEEAEQ